jgi:hypothetical protein
MTAPWHRLRAWMHRHPRLRLLAIAAINRFPALPGYLHRRGRVAVVSSNAGAGGFRQPLATTPARLDALGRRYWKELGATRAGNALEADPCHSTGNG